MPVLYRGLLGDRSVKQLRYLADTVLQYRLAQIPGVGRVDVTGGDQREIRVAGFQLPYQLGAISVCRRLPGYNQDPFQAVEVPFTHIRRQESGVRLPPLPIRHSSFEYRPIHPPPTT